MGSGNSWSQGLLACLPSPIATVSKRASSIPSLTEYFGRLAISSDNNAALYDGPRESIYSDSGIFTSSYDGNVYLRDVNGQIIRTFDATGKAEGINLWPSNGFSGGSLLSIANPFIKNTYSVDSTVTLYTTFLPPTDVKENNQFQNLSVFPNPVSDNLTIDLTASDNLLSPIVEIFNILGEKVCELTITERKTTFSARKIGLSPGIYILKTKSLKNVQTMKFVVL